MIRSGFTRGKRLGNPAEREFPELGFVESLFNRDKIRHERS